MVHDLSSELVLLFFIGRRVEELVSRTFHFLVDDLTDLEVVDIQNKLLFVLLSQNVEYQTRLGV